MLKCRHIAIAFHQFKYILIVLNEDKVQLNDFNIQSQVRTVFGSLAVRIFSIGRSVMLTLQGYFI